MTGALRKGGFPARVQRTAGAVRKLGCCVLASSFFLGGCSSGSSAMLATARHLYNASPPDSHTFRPGFSYLRATFEGRTAFLVLGYVDAHPEGPTEVWYSASGEAVRLRDGRLVGTAGLTTDWRAVRLFHTPAWPSANAAEPATARFSAVACSGSAQATVCSGPSG